MTVRVRFGTLPFVEVKLEGDAVEKETQAQIEGSAVGKPSFAIEELLSRADCRELYYESLRFCKTERSLSELEEAMAASPSIRTTVKSPGACVDTLVDAGALSARVLLNDGSSVTLDAFRKMLEDDLCNKDDGVVLLRTSQEGEEVLGAFSVARRLAGLFEDKPDLHEAYKAILRLCEEPQFVPDIEAELNRLGFSTKPQLGSDFLYPSAVLDALARTGAVQWDDGWKLTDEGGDALQSLS